MRRRRVYEAFGVSRWTRLRMWRQSRNYRRAKAAADAERAEYLRYLASLAEALQNDTDLA